MPDGGVYRRCKNSCCGVAYAGWIGYNRLVFLCGGSFSTWKKANRNITAGTVLRGRRAGRLRTGRMARCLPRSPRTVCAARAAQNEAHRHLITLTIIIRMHRGRRAAQLRGRPRAARRRAQLVRHRMQAAVRRGPRRIRRRAGRIPSRAVQRRSSPAAARRNLRRSRGTVSAVET